MSTAGAAPSIASSNVDTGDVEAERAVVVHTCTRLGLTANPPGFSFMNFFVRFGRRR